ncbi:peptide chain release factor N(5)-glutamine methyltransferase [uncultured Sphingomonas sp.]|uniref:peptide chain release factor N(5)-glutamine methyltransferase n=1 Tax=uncultured Sphingomonas sp. TaxID=158754 RepID=UPI0025EB987E|nr:peptide chain release factor N(5)-glutamine methyltransferase [uncultured Sphingomonas sp.]
MSLAHALAAAARRLAPVSDTPRLDAELLMAQALGERREDMLLAARDRAVPPAFENLIARRLAHEPVAYITGRRPFWTIELAVSPAVLIPRPDTETLMEAAVAHFGKAGPRRILDLGTGSGALLLAALSEWPDATGLGVDMSEAALAVAQANALALALDSRAAFAWQGWETGAEGGFDLVLCNPPYIAISEALPPDVLDHEPHSALFAGADGLDDYRLIAAALRLPPGGVACIEVGMTQADAVSALLGAQGFLTQVRRDLAGHQRCVVATPRH